ncbi:high frequency lysogenization protein HflD [Aliiglaciecola litoralis]|uniref:High frequency lysogenization protein HflD homolog n=1 Tax=Aliiglaciecola litoralis TaxID=582857 RepID=A0ABN1LCG3_9ALTE
MDNESEKSIALAGVCQAAALVQLYARKGQAPETAFAASLGSIINTNPASTLEVFGTLADIELGMSTLVSQLGNTPLEKDAEITRYVASILGLERKLSRQSAKMNELGERISQVNRQLAHFDLFDEQMIQNLASIYVDVISPVGPKIQVAGLPAMLQQNANQHRVRALLLAGVRAAVLWRQLGGQRRQILFGRRKIVANTQALQQLIHQF